jgi:hypothetical protein
MLQISVAGPRLGGKTTLAVLLKNLLRSQGFQDVKIETGEAYLNEVQASLPEGPKEKIQAGPIRIIEITEPLEVTLTGPPIKDISEADKILGEAIDSIDALKERMKATTSDKAPKYFVDKNHAGIVMGVAKTSGRKHDLEFVCTVEQNEEGAQHAQTICNLLNLVEA